MGFDRGVENSHVFLRNWFMLNDSGLHRSTLKYLMINPSPMIAARRVMTLYVTRWGNEIGKASTRVHKYPLGIIRRQQSQHIIFYVAIMTIGGLA